MNEQNSKKQILKASSIIGGASVITILIGLVKVKALAVLLGPTGVGLMGILLSFLTMGATVFGLGLGTIGVREIALHHKETEKVDQIRKALFLANMILGSLAFILTILNRKYLSQWLFNTPEQQWVICIVGFGIFISLIGSSQSAVLQGFRRINEQAKIKIFSALVSTLIGLGLIWWLGIEGITGFVVVVPIIGCLLGFYYTRKLPKLNSKKLQWSELWSLWKAMAGLGFIYMLSGFMGEGTKLLVREILNQKIDLKAVGYFQAAWSISMTYIGFVLGAMAADYYPRLTQVIYNKEQTNELVNQQTEIALVFAGPILLGMLTFAPWVIHLLYSNEFTPAIEILRWQVVGDIFKIISWPLGFIVLALGRGKFFFILELSWNLTYLFLVNFCIYYFYTEVTGYAFAISYLIYLFLTYLTTSNLSAFYWNKKNKIYILYYLLTSFIILICSYYSEFISILLGCLFITVSVRSLIISVNDLGIRSSKLNKLFVIANKVVKINK